MDGILKPNIERPCQEQTVSDTKSLRDRHDVRGSKDGVLKPDDEGHCSSQIISKSDTKLGKVLHTAS